MPMTQAEYARHRGVSRPMVSKWVNSGKIPEEAFVDIDGKRLIDEAVADAALDRTRERVVVGRPVAGDATFGSNASARGGGGSGAAALTTYKTLQSSFDARLSAAKWRDYIGTLRTVADIKVGAEACGVAIVAVLDDKKLRAEELLSVATKEGLVGLRRVLADIVFAERTQIAKALEQLLAGEKEISLEQLEQSVLGLDEQKAVA
jgi:hypothetical protein